MGSLEHLMARAPKSTPKARPPAPTVDVPRDRFHLTIDSELIDWINDNSDAGGRFRSHGDAVERGWARLEAERTFIVGRCKETSTPFKLLAFRQLYAADLEAGRQGHIEQRLVRYR